MRIPYTFRSRPFPGAVALTLLVAFLAGLPPGAVPASAAETAITDGTVTWGIKESWRSYIGADGITLDDGLTQSADGELRWPVTSGTFDESSNALVLQLGGVAHFEKYCSDGSCQLDSTFSDLSVVITADQQVIRGTYAGVPQDDPGGEVETVDDVVLATLDISGATPEVAGGQTSWPALGAHAGGPPFDLYPAGTSLDPVTVHYTGPGGAPDPGDEFDVEGTPVLAQGATWVAGDDVGDRRSVYASPGAEVVHVVEYYGASSQEDPHYTVRALDTASMEQVSATTVALGDRQSFRTAFDPATESIYYYSGDGADVTVSRVGYSGSGEGYTASEQVGTFMLDGTTAAFHVYSMVWNATTSELALIAGASGTSNFDAYTLYTFRRADGGEWSTAAGQLSIARTGVLEGAESIQDPFGPAGSSWSGKPSKTLAVARDGSYVSAPRNSSYVKDSESYATPALWVRAGPDGATAAPIDGTIPAPDSFGTDTRYSFAGALGASDGSVLLHGSHWSSTYQYVDIVDGEATAPMDPFTVFDEVGANIGAAGDPERGFDYVYNITTHTLTVLKGQEALSTVAVPDGHGHFTNTSFPLAVTGDGSVILQVEDPETGNVGLRRRELAGVTPTVMSDPADRTVVLGAGETSAPASFTSTATGEPAPSRQWQVKTAEAAQFSDIDGATDETLEVEAAPELDGARYRAVYTNDAGTVVSDVATLAVTAERPGAGEQQVTVTVPETTEPGEFVWSVDGDHVVDLGEATSEGGYLQAAGAIDPIAVRDTREGGPAWSISGQVSDFGDNIPGSYLGWTPGVLTDGAGAVAGDPVAPGIDGGEGLAEASVLAAATSGHDRGSGNLGADLDLRLPVDTEQGTYTATLTITALS